MYPRSVLDGPWPDPTAALRGLRKSYADPRGCHQPNPKGAVRTALSFLFEHDLRANAPCLSRGKPVPTPHQVRGRLFPDHALFTGGFGTPRARIGRAEQSVVGHGDRIGRGLAHRFDDGVTLCLQGRDHIVGKTVLDP